MPLYEYSCTACGYKFEKIQNFSAKPETECPKCQGELIRPVTAPALRFAGAGWYVNDYAGKGGAKTGDGEAPAASGEAAAKDAKPEAKSEAKSDSGGGSEKAAAPAPAASPAPASAPSSTPASS